VTLPVAHYASHPGVVGEFRVADETFEEVAVRIARAA
jgi:hypothetical protein